MRTFVVLVIIAIVILVAGTLLYFFFIQGQGDPWSGIFDTENSSDASSGLTGASEISTLISEEQAIEQLPPVSLLIDTESLGTTLSENGSEIIYYDAWDNELRKSNLAGEKTGSAYILGNSPQEIIWSPDKQSYIYQSEDSQYYYGQLGGEEVLLGTNIESPVFDTEGELWYRSVGPEQQISYIKLGNPASGLTDSLEIIPASGGVVIKRVPNRPEVAYYLAPSVHRSSGVYFLNKEGGKQLAVSKGAAVTVSWSPAGNYLAFTRLGDGDRVTLWLADGEGKNSRQLERPTFIDKIAWSPDEQKMYLAVPKLMPTAQSYFEKTSQIEDKLYEVDMTSGDTREISNFSELDEPIDARDIFLSENGKILYFRNSYNDSIYAVNLEKT